MLGGEGPISELAAVQSEQQADLMREVGALLYMLGWYVLLCMLGWYVLLCMLGWYVLCTLGVCMVCAW